MGMNSIANLGYGFPLGIEYSSGKAWEQLEEAVSAHKNLKLIYHGDDEPYFAVCIKDSIQEVWACDEIKILKSQDLVVKDKWKNILNLFAKKIGVTKPKIGRLFVVRYS